MNFRQFLVIVIFLAFLFSCKKDVTKFPPPPPPVGSDYSKDSFIVFTNGADLRLAEIKTSEGKTIIFYGQRDGVGKPIFLSGYAISTLPDSTKIDYVTFDDSSRYSNFFLKTGQSLHLNYDIQDTLQFTVRLTDTTLRFDTTFSHNVLSKGITPVVFGNSNGSNILGSDGNINTWVTSLNVFNKNPKTLGYEGDVAVIVLSDLSQGSDLSDYFLPAYFNPFTGYFTLSTAAAGYTYTDDPITNTLQIIKNAIDIACTKTNSRYSALNVNAFQIIDAVFCKPLGNFLIVEPELAVFCKGISAMKIVCEANDVFDNHNYSLLGNASQMLKNIVKTKHQRDLEANVFVEVISGKFGNKNSENLTFGAILSNSGPYDFNINYDYDEEPNWVGNFKGTAITESDIVDGVPRPPDQTDHIDLNFRITKVVDNKLYMSDPSGVEYQVGTVKNGHADIHLEGLGYQSNIYYIENYSFDLSPDYNSMSGTFSQAFSNEVDNGTITLYRY
jgi:hypothetical protein